MGQEEPDPTDACPETPPEAPFTDRDDIPDVHVRNVDCGYELGIIDGFTDNTFRPRIFVRRDQMASFVHDTLDAAGIDLPDPDEHEGFDDVPGGNVHSDAIESLAAANIIFGTGGGNFSPSDDIRRDQVASFALRAVGYAVEPQDLEDLQSDDQAFVDVPPGNVHFENVNGAADLGIIVGGPGALTSEFFGPAQSTRRDQMAAITARLYVVITSWEDFEPTPEPTPVPVSFTDAPELIDAEITDFDDGDNELTVLYVFDEVVSATVDETAFGLTAVDGTHLEDGHANVTVTAERDADDRDTVEVVFDLTGASADILDLNFEDEDSIDFITTAWVDTGAVSDVDGDNPEGSVGLQAVTFDAGETLGPNLSQVGGISGDSASFVFDEDLDAAPGEDDLVLINEDGELFFSDTCVLVTNNENVARCTFDDMAGLGGTAFSAANDGPVVRAYAEEAVVTGDDSELDNAPQAVVVSGGGTVDDFPDLVGIDVNFDDGFVDYEFDENVTLTGATPDFRIYDALGDTYTHNAEAIGFNQRVVRVEYDADELAVAVGTFVQDDSVRDVDDGNPNRADHEGIAFAFDAGEAAVPILVTVTVDGDDDEVVFTFDRDIDEENAANEVALYEEDGTRHAVEVQDCDIEDNEIVCEIGAGLLPGDFSEEEAEAAVLGGVAYDTVFWDAESGTSMNRTNFADSEPVS